ncbi:MAG: DUF1559 domain-containing protein [Phycisphaeraceae bacterium]
MQLLTSPVFLTVFLVSAIVIPLIGGAILRLVFKLMGVPGTTYRRCWLAYLAAWLTASVLCTALMILYLSSSNPASLRSDVIFLVAIATHLVIVPLVMRVGWGKAAAAQVITIVTYTLLLIPVVLPFVAHLRGKAERVLAMNSVRTIADAMLRYHDTVQALPSDAIYSKDGKPLLSWRVALLPYLEQQALYDQFKLDEPWDSPHNKALIEKMPVIYKMPGIESPAGVTHFQVFVQTWPAGVSTDAGTLGRAPFGQLYPMRPPVRLKMSAILDGPANTLLVAEAADAVPWTKPADIPFGPDIPLPKLGAVDDGLFVVVFLDSHTQFLPTDIDPKTLRAIITMDGNEPASIP